jgi:hypothetical protein
MATVKKTKKAQTGMSVGVRATQDTKTGSINRLDRFKNVLGEDRYYRSTGNNLSDLGKQNSRKAMMNSADSTRYSTLTPEEKKYIAGQENPKSKNGSKVKAKDGKWMQKVSKSIKARGTEGKCTPITKPGCTGRAKALAKTFKRIAAKRKAK